MVVPGSTMRTAGPARTVVVGAAGPGTTGVPGTVEVVVVGVVVVGVVVVGTTVFTVPVAARGSFPDTS